MHQPSTESWVQWGLVQGSRNKPCDEKLGVWRPQVVDWNKIEAEVTKEEKEEELDGDAGVQKLFRSIYAGARARLQPTIQFQLQYIFFSLGHQAHELERRHIFKANKRWPDTQYSGVQLFRRHPSGWRSLERGAAARGAPCSRSASNPQPCICCQHRGVWRPLLCARAPLPWTVETASTDPVPLLGACRRGRKHAPRHE